MSENLRLMKKLSEENTEEYVKFLMNLSAEEKIDLIVELTVERIHENPRFAEGLARTSAWTIGKSHFKEWDLCAERVADMYYAKIMERV